MRKRIAREMLRSDRDPDGTVRVYVPVEGTANAMESLPQRELISELRGRIEDLRTDRDAWRDQARRSDYLASAALERTRELEDRLRALEAPDSSKFRDPDLSTTPTRAPAEDGEGLQTVEEDPEGVEPPSGTAGSRRPWWRSVFGQ